jgi:hypothetical protein
MISSVCTIDKVVVFAQKCNSDQKITPALTLSHATLHALEPQQSRISDRFEIQKEEAAILKEWLTQAHCE